MDDLLAISPHCFYCEFFTQSASYTLSYSYIEVYYLACYFTRNQFSSDWSTDIIYFLSDK